jgi:hypothetical protein
VNDYEVDDVDGFYTHFGVVGRRVQTIDIIYFTYFVDLIIEN